MVNQEVQDPVEYHVGNTGNPIAEELDVHVFAERWIEEINEATDLLTCRYEYFSHSVCYNRFFKRVCAGRQWNCAQN